MPTDPDRIQEIFADALEMETLAEREAYIEAACSADADVMARVRALLNIYPEVDNILPTAPVNPILSDELQTEGLGTVIGRYKLLQEIGEGGFGAVYMAEQTKPVERRVALKIIKPGMDTKDVITFEGFRSRWMIPF